MKKHTTITIPVHKELDNEIRKSKLTRIFTFIALVIFVSSGINNILLGDINSGILIEIIGGCTLFALILNYYNKNDIALSYLFILLSLAIFYFSSYSGIASGSYLYNFPLFFAIANVFSMDNASDRKLLIGLTSFLIGLVMINIITSFSLFTNPNLLPAQKKVMFGFNFGFSLLSMGYFLFLMIKNNQEKFKLFQNLIEEETKMRGLEAEKTHEQEVLLAELQHRAHNNLSVITSILKLKHYRYENNGVDSQKEVALKESLHAIQTISNAHKLQLHKNGKLMVNIPEYVDQIVTDYESMIGTNELRLELSLSDYLLDIKQAIPFGLLIHELLMIGNEYIRQNECLTLHLKHAKNGKELITLSLKDIKDKVLLNRLIEESLIQSLIEQTEAEFDQAIQHELHIKIPLMETIPYIESDKLYTK